MKENEDVSKNLEQKAFFEKVSKLQYSEVFIPIFQKRTDQNTRKVSMDGKEIVGNILGSSKLKMTLSNDAEFVYVKAPVMELIARNVPLALKVLIDDKAYPLLMSVYATERKSINSPKSEGNDGNYDLDFFINRHTFSLLSKENRIISLRIIHNLVEKISNNKGHWTINQVEVLREGRAGDGGGAGPR